MCIKLGYSCIKWPIWGGLLTWMGSSLTSYIILIDKNEVILKVLWRSDSFVVKLRCVRKLGYSCLKWPAWGSPLGWGHLWCNISPCQPKIKLPIKFHEDLTSFAWDIMMLALGPPSAYCDSPLCIVGLTLCVRLLYIQKVICQNISFFV